MTSSELVVLLKQVPEKRLRLVELAWEVLDSEGNLDPQKTIVMMAEIKTAVSEAEHYAKTTAAMTAALARLAPPWDR
jgi:hypothetical protein